MGLAPNRSTTFAGDRAACEVPGPIFYSLSGTKIEETLRDEAGILRESLQIVKRDRSIIAQVYEPASRRRSC